MSLNVSMHVCVPWSFVTDLHVLLLRLISQYHEKRHDIQTWMSNRKNEQKGAWLNENLNLDSVLPFDILDSNRSQFGGSVDRLGRRAHQVCQQKSARPKTQTPCNPRCPKVQYCYTITTNTLCTPVNYTELK